jgi:hypothetical protein
MIRRPGILYSCEPSCGANMRITQRKDEKATANLVKNKGLRLDCVDRKVRRTDLLRDTTSFTLLDICLANLFSHGSSMSLMPMTSGSNNSLCLAASFYLCRHGPEYSK